MSGRPSAVLRRPSAHPVIAGALFVPESITIVAFAIFWLVKGEVDAPVLRAYHAMKGT